MSRLRIRELTLYSSDLQAQYNFYAERLGFPMQYTAERLTLPLRYARLHFEQQEAARPYHFALNIGSWQEQEALQWLEQRVDILRDGTNKIQDFSAWNARAIYFYDADQNIVEFIARRDLQHHAGPAFGPESLFEISEIGLATANLPAKLAALQKYTGLQRYSGDVDTFCAVGSAEGLFIVIDKEGKDWYPTDDPAYASDFVATVEVDEHWYRVAYQSEVLEITTAQEM